MDEEIAQMVAITSTTPDRAAQYLQLADGDVNQAVSLFFENGGADLSGALPSASTQPALTGITGAGNAQDPINIEDDDENISDDNDPEITGYRKKTSTQQAEDDEAMARRLQEEMYGGSGGGEDEPVRAPIARQAETLLGPSSNFYGPSLDDAVEERMRSLQSRRSEYISM